MGQREILLSNGKICTVVCLYDLDYIHLTIMNPSTGAPMKSPFVLFQKIANISPITSSELFSFRPHDQLAHDVNIISIFDLSFPVFCDVIRSKTRSVRLSGYGSSQFANWTRISSLSSFTLDYTKWITPIQRSILISVQCDTHIPCLHIAFIYMSHI